MIRAAAYCRVSTDRQDQANSFAAQQRFFREYIQGQPDWILHKIYADEGISGTSTRKRAAFHRMVSDALEGNFTVILTKEVSRFSRNILDTIAYTRELKAAGVAVYFLNDGFDTLEPDAELKLSIMASLAQEESRRTSSRVAWGQQRQMERGVVFGHDLLGYRVNGGKMTVEPEGAQTVKLIFHKYGLEGASMRQIARYLEEKGISNRDGSTQWKASAIGKLLRNEKYVGDLVQRKTYTADFLTHRKAANHGQVPKIVLKNHHEPIIPRDLWEKVQARLRENQVAEGRGNRYALSGKVICGCCGSRFVGRTKATASGSYRRWCCGKAAQQGSHTRLDSSGNILGCDVGRLLREDDGIYMIQTALNSLNFSRESVIEPVVSAAMDAIGTGYASRQQDCRRILRKRQTMLNSFFSGDISREDMISLKQQYDARLEQLSAAEAEILPDREALEKCAGEILSGQRESTLFYRTILQSITIFHNRPRELRFHNLDCLFFFS